MAASHVKEGSMKAKERGLRDLVSVGPAMAKDFQLLGIHSVEQLAKHDPRRLYDRLQQKVGHTMDVCVLDTFCAAVAQAKNPKLPAEQCQWWYWSRKRKQNENRTKA
jgi:nucleotidyltransferase/DNA polymerase involved in DNA repair